MNVSESQVARSTAMMFLVVVAMTLVGSCRTYYVFPPVEVTTEQVSPAYQLWIENRLDADLTVLPSSDSVNLQNIVLNPGESQSVGTIVVKRLKVGDSPAPQIVEGPYIEVEAAGVGAIHMQAATEATSPVPLPCDLRLHVSDATWFDELEPQMSSDPPHLRICIDDCVPGRDAFQQGPQANECS